MSAAASASRQQGPIGWFRDPWRKPHILRVFTWGYVAWSLVPVAIAIAISFTAGRSSASVQGFSIQWWHGAPGNDPQGSLFTDPTIRAGIAQSLKLSVGTMIIAVPLGVAFAIGLDRWRGRVAAGANFMMLLSFVMPEIIIGVSMFEVFNYLLKFVHLGTEQQLLGLITYQISYPVIVCRARLLSIGSEYEEAAMDLGARPRQAIRRVLLPLLYPAIFASFALVFADTIDDFVTVRYLSGLGATEPLSVQIYGAVRGTPTPEYNAAATFLLVSTSLVISLGFLAWKFFGRGQGATDAQSFAGTI
jgi:spermidine/putrescine transport system permease protein